MSTADRPIRQTWDRVLSGDVTAFQTVVEKHQSAVSAVAFAILGDFSLSQDITQETFWLAWKQRNSLRDTRKLSSWLCGIARNLARQWRRRHRRQATAGGGDLPFEPASEWMDPSQESVAEEEQRVVWGALEEIPENYREVLTLYYRQGQSVAEVAKALDLSEPATRQRLSRGRTMLRGRVAELIEGVLVRSKPGQALVTKIMAGLTGAGIAGKTGSAAASSAAWAQAGSGSVFGAAAGKGLLATGAGAGFLGGMLGAVGGLGGAFLGSWLPAEVAPTETERQLIRQQGRVTMGLSIIFTVAVFAWVISFIVLKFSPVIFLVGMAVVSLAFTIPIIILSVRLSRLVRDLRTQLTPEDDPNQSRLAAYGKRKGYLKKRRGRSYRSAIEFLGYPLIDIQFRDIDPTHSSNRNARKAKGWIAIGDQASGILFAAGGIARGLIAMGGIAVGGIALGGVSLGIMTLGGLAAGLLAVGGCAVGYDAVGGAAIGWHSAAGGGGIAWHAATGGAAIANDYAVGGLAIAEEANTPAAEQVIENETFQAWLHWVVDNQFWFTIGVLVISFAPMLVSRWVYRCADDDEFVPKTTAESHAESGE